MENCCDAREPPIAISNLNNGLELAEMALNSFTGRIADFFEESGQLVDFILGPFARRTDAYVGFLGSSDIFRARNQSHVLHLLNDQSSTPLLVDQIGHHPIHHVSLCKATTTSGISLLMHRTISSISTNEIYGNMILVNILRMT